MLQYNIYDFVEASKVIEYHVVYLLDIKAHLFQYNKL